MLKLKNSPLSRNSYKEMIASTNKRNKWDTDSIKIKFIEVHGYRYDYSKFVYSGIDNKSTVICSIHGEFRITAYDHTKRGCSTCGKIISILKRTKTTSTFINQAKNLHKDLIYDKTNYVRGDIEVCITCPQHGDYFYVPTLHLLGNRGCKVCEKETYRIAFLKRTKTHEQFLIDAFNIHGDEYDYLESYVNCTTHMKMRHKKCNRIFRRTPNLHLKETGCRSCKAGEAGGAARRDQRSRPAEAGDGPLG